MSSETPSQPIHTITDTDNPNGGFGAAISISGTRLIVGTNDDFVSGTRQGRAFVFDLSGPTPEVPAAILTSPIGGSDRFGKSVAIDGLTIVVGAEEDDEIYNNRGAVFLFGPASDDTDNDGLLDLWEFARFGTLAGHSAQDDTDQDGLPELLELAFDRDPTRADTWAAQQPILEAGFLTITLTKRAGVSYKVESAANPDATAFSEMNTTVLIDNPTLLKVRDNVPYLAGGSRFMRVLVTSAP